MEGYTKETEKACFNKTRERLENLIDKLRDKKALKMEHSEIEGLIEKEGRDVLRQAFQDHLDLRHLREERFEGLIGADKILRNHVRERSRTLRTNVGTVQVRRFSYSRLEEMSLRPLDAELNLPTECRYSFGLIRRMVENAVRMSFDATLDNLKRTAGIDVPKRQVEEQLRFSSQGFREFYENKAAAGPQDTDDLMIMSTDGKGVVMRYKDLRYETRLKLREAQLNQKGNRLDGTAKPNRKRMSTVAAVYSTPRLIRTAEDVFAKKELSDDPAYNKKKFPRPKDKRVWASLWKAEDVIESVFKEAEKRDPEHRREWVFLVDGDRGQLELIRKIAKRRKAQITIVCDFVHLLEYVWNAAYSFFPSDHDGASACVETKALEILRGKASYVAAGMRRSATKRKLEKNERKAIDDCARYLLNHRAYLKYDFYLASGFPIASGVIEGTCRHLINDRLDLTGAHWSLHGAETMLRMRAIWASGDLDEYWEFMRKRNFEGYYQPFYKGIKPYSRPKLAA